MDCYTIGPDSRCFCGHSYKAHAWYNTETKRLHCRCPDCRCEGFRYVTGHGAWWIKCACHHSHEDHRVDGVMGACQRAGCSCTGFFSSFSCACGDAWAHHATVVETRSEREAAGRPVHNLCGGGGGDGAAAAGGGVTRMSSLVPGIDRLETPLPFTDAGAFATPDETARALEAVRAEMAVARTAQQLDSSTPPHPPTATPPRPPTSPPRQVQLNLGQPRPSSAAVSARRSLIRTLSQRPPPSPPSPPSPRRLRAGASPRRLRPARPAGRPGGGTGGGGRGAGGSEARRLGGQSRRGGGVRADQREIAELEMQLLAEGPSAATRHGLKRQIALKRAALKRDLPASSGR